MFEKVAPRQVSRPSLQDALRIGCKVIFREGLPERTEALCLFLAPIISVIADDFSEGYRAWAKKASVQSPTGALGR
ncbi:hypothetical protein FOZG_18525 [Fusarium oxysporum Fo47]|uniref:Uncharacterized protein n=1 Tax=Fusarium oxysporum Fo47 TaxID=660027 RepID=W9JBD9_FUSOX|nr:hypothetical protein FOZG_18525 [Fusarium oxysporum Fo47]